MFLTGVVVLAGWLFNVTILKSFHAGLITMKPNTAVCFILLGVSLWLSQTKRTGPRSRFVAQACALVAALLALATLLEYGLARDLGIDQLWFTDAKEISKFSPPGRMTPMTAWILLFAGLGLLGLDWEGPRNTRPAQTLALLAGACSLLGMFLPPD